MTARQVTLPARKSAYAVRRWVCACVRVPVCMCESPGADACSVVEGGGDGGEGGLHVYCGSCCLKPRCLNPACLGLSDSFPNRWKVLWEPPGAVGKIRMGQMLTALLASPTHPFMLLFFFHRGLIANGFTETHYLQDGTDISLTRNYTVSPAGSPPQTPTPHPAVKSVLKLCSCFILHKATCPDSLLGHHKAPMCHLGFRHSIRSPGKLGLSQLCARTVLGNMADLETTFQLLREAQLGKPFLENLATFQDGLESSCPWAELSCVLLQVL